MNLCKKTLAVLLLNICFTMLFASAVTFAAPTLKINAQGKDVISLQKTLYSLNYKITSFDGIFGKETKQAVLEFQRDQRMRITGVVDNKTWNALKKAKPIQPLPVVKTPAATNLPTKQPPLKENQLKIKDTKPFVDAKQVPSIIKKAKSYIGVPYKFGGTTPKGFDCSGYIQYVFGQYKYQLPRAADTQYNIGQKVTKTNLREGDLVFFSTYEKGASHCGIYVGKNQFIHASTSKGIRIDSLNDVYWQPRYLGAKRIVK